jgi:hypothetical protein
MTSTLFFDGIIVIESLDKHEGMEPPTGEWLHNRVLKKFEKADFLVQHRPVITASGLHRELERVRDEVAANGHRPILHFDCHGDKDGLRLADGTHVPWNDIRAVLAQINERTQCNLLVVMALCSGAHLVKIVKVDQRTPVWAIVGPLTSVDSDPLYAAMAGFYETLLTTLDGSAAIKAMQATADGQKFKAYTAEMIFCWAFSHYIRASAPEQLKARENDLVAILTARKGLDINQVMVERETVRAALHDHRRWYDLLRHQFLMLDVDHSLAQRFSLSYEECFKDRSPDADSELVASAR